jgi:hypothetical protein
MATPGGERPIASIAVGDLVYSVVDEAIVPALCEFLDASSAAIRVDDDRLLRAQHAHLLREVAG